MTSTAPGSDSPADRSLRPGRMLRDARERAGISAEALAAELNFSPKVLASLETDDYDNLPEPVFVRGYMRRYADRVGLSPDEVAERFDGFYQADTGRSPQAGVRPNPVRLLGEIDGESRRRRPFPWKRGLLTVAGLLVAGLLALAVVAYGDRSSGLMKGIPQPAAAPADAMREQVLPGAVTTPSARDRLVLTLQADCRILVRDAEGRDLVSGQRKAGEELRVEGMSPFSIELQPASAVRLHFNDQPIDLGPYTVNDIVNFRLSR